MYLPKQIKTEEQKQGHSEGEGKKSSRAEMQTQQKSNSHGLHVTGC